jgi:hypothetical protein
MKKNILFVLSLFFSSIYMSMQADAKLGAGALSAAISLGSIVLLEKYCAEDHRLVAYGIQTVAFVLPPLSCIEFACEEDDKGVHKKEDWASIIFVDAIITSFGIAAMLAGDNPKEFITYGCSMAAAKGIIGLLAG